MGLIKQIIDKFKPTRKHTASVYTSYNESRTIKDKKHLCHAPFNNMYFNSLGDVANCWLTFDNPEKYSEERTIREIWEGEKFSQLREHIKNQNLSARCGTCKKYIENGNYVNALAKAYDNEYPLSDYPTMMEFELTNTCNLECTMCTGVLSSSIRANRDKLPKLISPYGEKFVQELGEFIPHLHEARFNGGEPFLIKIYFDIWAKFEKLNPECKIVVATNGTTLNSRIKEVISKGNFHFNISIDSLDPERYKSIRVNGNLNKVLTNFEYFKNYCQTQNRSLCIMINPMRTNWQEMPDFVNFCNKHGVNLWFNSIMHPEDQAIWNLPYAQLKNIYSTLQKANFVKFDSTPEGLYKYNTDTYYNLVENQIKTWMNEAEKRRSIGKTETQTQETNKQKFMNKLNAYALNQSKENDVVEQMEEKLREMENRIAQPEQVAMFYSLICDAPMETIMQHLLNHDIETAFESFKLYSQSKSE